VVLFRTAPHCFEGEWIVNAKGFASCLKVELVLTVLAGDSVGADDLMTLPCMFLPPVVVECSV